MTALCGGLDEPVPLKKRLSEFCASATQTTQECRADWLTGEVIRFGYRSDYFPSSIVNILPSKKSKFLEAKFLKVGTNSV